MRDHALLARLEGLVTQYPAAHLHIGHVARKLADGVQAAAVYIFIRVILE